MATLLDWGNVDGACARIEKNLGLRNRQEAFSFLCISTFLKIDFDEVRGCITEGGNDRGIDAVYLDERFGRRTIHLFQFKRYNSFSIDGRNFPAKEIDKILSFIGDCFGQAPDFLNTCNPILKQKVIDIWTFVKEGQSDVEIHLCSNGQKLLPDQRQRFDSSLARFRFARVHEADLDSISEIISRNSNRDREIVIPAVEDQIFERTDGSVRAIIATVRADEFISAIKDEVRPDQLDSYLFEENVRVYLGEQNEVNKRIFETAISDESVLFWYYNNGVTIVCERFSFQSAFRNAPIKLVNPQIVNGGQTSYALFEASKARLDALSRVKLLVRIIETQDRALYSKVAEATNSQTPIRSRDLRSNDPTLMRLESSLAAQDWYLDRKRDQHSDKPEARRIDALKLGQMWLAYVIGEPDKAKTASDKIFGEFYPLIFDPANIDANRTLAIWKIYSILEDERRKYINNSRKITRRRGEEILEGDWMVEGIYHFAYAVKKSAELRGINIFDIDQIKSVIPDAKKRMDSFIGTQPRVSFYRLFRLSATKQSLFDNAFDDKQLRLDLGA